MGLIVGRADRQWRTLAGKVADICAVTTLLNSAAAFGHRFRHIDWREVTQQRDPLP
jgi:hypothetical protein